MDAKGATWAIGGTGSLHRLCAIEDRRRLMFQASVALLIGLAQLTLPAPPAAAPSAPIGRATLDDGLSVEGADIQAEAISSRLTLPVLVDKAGPFKFLIDTAADRSVIGLRLSQQLGLPPVPEARVHSVAGVLSVPMVHVDELTLAHRTIFDVAAPSLREEFLGAQGILGLDAIGEQRLLLDFEHRTMRLEDAKHPDFALGDDIVVTAKRRQGQLILARAEVAGVQVDAVIDTGAEVTVGNVFLERMLMAHRRALPTGPSSVLAVTGQRIAVNRAFVPEMRIGRLRIGRFAMVFADAPPFNMFGLADRPAVLLGADVLEQFRSVSMDFRRRTIRFRIPRN